MGGLALQLPAEVIRISVSDLLYDTIAASLEETAQARGDTYVLKEVGSQPAMVHLEAEQTDLAIIAVSDGGALPAGDFRVQPFAFDAAVVVVNQDNPLNEITLDQLGSIFGQNESMSLITWGQLNLPGWDNRSIKAMAAQSESVALELFKHTVLLGSDLKSGVAQLKQSAVERIIESDPSVIAILPGLPVSNKIKPLMISQDDQKPAFGPSENNILYGDYPIRLAFYLVYRTRDTAKLEPIFSTLYSDVVAEELRQNQFFSLPDPVRRQVKIDFEFKK